VDIKTLYDEVQSYIDDIDPYTAGERLYSNYQKIAAYALRMTEIRNELVLMEIAGTSTPEIKKFRTMILDPTIERFDELARYESRKITAVGYEMSLEGKR
jgi:hypothetical protein